MRIIDKNRDYYDWLSHTEISDDSVALDRRNSELLTKGGFCEAVAWKVPPHRKADVKPSGRTWKKWLRQMQDHYYPLAVVAGTNLFIVHLVSPVYSDAAGGRRERAEVLADFSPVLVCTRKIYRDLGIPLGIFEVHADWYWPYGTGRWRDDAESWEKANLADLRFGSILPRGKMPILAQTGLASILPADQVYYGIEERLLAMKAEKTRESAGLTDREKAVNHGFDARTSFRNM